MISDTETTGLKPFGDNKNKDIKDRLIEVAFIFYKMENGRLEKLVDDHGDFIYFHEYINPFQETPAELARYNSIKSIPQFLYRTHGISDDFLAGKKGLLDSNLNETSFNLPKSAPTFDMIKPIISKMLCIGEKKNGTIFYVAHNGIFDTNFLSAEWSKCEQYHENHQQPAAFESYVTLIDTLPLIREMYPTVAALGHAYQQKPHYNQATKINYKLDFLIEFYQCHNVERDVHGALIDSMILADVYQAMLDDEAYISLPLVKSMKQNIETVKKLDSKGIKTL
ncbi:hypothetical protein [Photobacterium damselae]|uniref:hypothetical protein n=1 Tax=Photobacterium damselae TaxID=38293 RepID=UPI001F264FEF|nr:hypothetical protein [Photobacterium damselae]UKA04651.1 hypothetical protein IHC89_23820 [Photobacterium damselae subsp. damselae]